MNITTTTSLVSFLVALSAFNIPAEATINSTQNILTNVIETRLAKISNSLQARENQLLGETNTPLNIELAGAFANKTGGGGFANKTGGGGFVNTHGGGFRNGGGGFVNKTGGGGFVNRR